MKRFLIPVAGLVGVLAVAAALFVGGGFVATNALASGGLAQAGGAPWAQQLPPELKGLANIPAGDRFNHFKGVTINLTDQNNQALSVTVTPGTVSSISGNSLGLSANDGSTKTYTTSANTIERGQTAPATGDKVVVVTLNGSNTATAVMTTPAGGFGPHPR